MPSGQWHVCLYCGVLKAIHATRNHPPWPSRGQLRGEGLRIRAGRWFPGSQPNLETSCSKGQYDFQHLLASHTCDFKSLPGYAQVQVATSPDLCSRGSIHWQSLLVTMQFLRRPMLPRQCCLVTWLPCNQQHVPGEQLAASCTSDSTWKGKGQVLLMQGEGVAVVLRLGRSHRS